MNVQPLAIAILRDWGVRDLTAGTATSNLNARGTGTGDLDAVARYINGALEELFDIGPAWISRQPGGAPLRPRTTGTVNVTEYGATVASFTTFASWMVGCTIRINGDDADNEVVSATKLRRPYMGATATGKAFEVWGDAVLLPTNLERILEPVTIPNLIGLKLAASFQDFLTIAGYSPVVTARSTVNPASISLKDSGQPSHYFVDTRFDRDDATTGNLSKILRVAPMPAQAYALEYVGKLKAPVITAANIGSQGSDPGVVIPAEWQESVLLPICRQRASSDPAFVNLDGKPELFRQYQRALQILTNGARPVVAAQEGSYGV